MVLEAGRSASDEELAAHCRASLAPYKLPKRFGVIEALPRNANGKVLKTELRSLNETVTA